MWDPTLTIPTTVVLWLSEGGTDPPRKGSS
ncbi:hypothetical protein GADJET_94 [Mycobacterium phage Gadjet]|uniref:Uncharacterized protein n=1 Tax=Mycobacterium phage Gadjet TaxID=1089122 RepID=G8I3X4_9CAUD|nr:hypothetical protein CM02_gp094 [Mycobacterium phage Gadjet]AER47426.1 hypothetical protein GADJET_94 [Mycobacterium phage Gadjet]